MNGVPKIIDNKPILQHRTMTEPEKLAPVINFHREVIRQ
jgi:hypothetical protein